MSRVLVDSGIKWIGSLPNTWSITTVNKIFYRRKEVNDIENPTVLSLARDGVKIRDISTNEGQLAESYDNYHKVYKDDLMINPMDLISGANCSLSEVEGVISPAYINLAKKEKIFPKYYDYIFKYQYWINSMFIHGKGVSFDNRWTMNWETMSNYKLPFPKYEEQKNIANYLDRQCEKIKRIIDDNINEIELIEEYKRRIIFEKTSSGKIIKIKKIGYVNGRIGFKGYSNEDIVDEETPGRALSIGGTNIMKSGTLSYDKKTYISEKKYLESPEIMLRGGEILMTKVGAGCGENSIYEFYEDRVTINPNVMILHVNNGINSKYINYCLLNDEVRSNIKIESTSGGAQPAINQELLKNLKINLPPINEQNKIVNYLDRVCSKLDTVINYRKQIIEKLEEYKRSLIYECVTGKREV